MVGTKRITEETIKKMDDQLLQELSREINRVDILIVRELTRRNG